MNYKKLFDYGFSDERASSAAEFDSLFAGRVISQTKNLYRVVSEGGIFLAEVSGKFRYDARSRLDFPTVGDFVMMDRESGEEGNAVIHHILPRKSLFSRRGAGEKGAQSVAANVDIVLLCMSLNNDFNLRRLERYLSLAWDSGAMPIIALTKADLCDDALLQRKMAAAQSVACGTEILLCSSLEEGGLGDVLELCAKGKTLALVGSSGVGKSTIVNHLLNRQQLYTREIRADDKGRHSTTHRELFLLQNGGILIDTPGMRELGMTDCDDGFEKSFSDVEEHMQGCRFRNCTHTNEPGCAVALAIANGELSPVRLAAYRKLKTEASYAEDRDSFMKSKRERQKEISKSISELKKNQKGKSY